MTSVKIYFFFTFCSHINLEATVVKTGEIIGLTIVYPFFLLIGKKYFSKIFNNYRIAHQKKSHKK